MAISSYKTFLMKGTGTDTITWAKLIDIKSFPDLGGDPEQLETTTLSDPAQTFIPGIRQQESLSFTANYTKTDYETLKALEGTSTKFAVWFGGTESGGVVTPDGSDGKYKFDGDLRVRITGKGVNEVQEMTITITPSTAITADTQ